MRRQPGFRPLSGYLISKSFIIPTAINNYYKGFRPLSGYLISKFMKESVSKIYIAVSVPSRGILFPNFNLSTLLFTLYCACGFPSPLGVSYFQMRILRKLLIHSLLSFPSPLGVSYFQINLNTVVWEQRFSSGFRPLSGYLISKFESKVEQFKAIKGFRPLSGYLISKSWQQRLKKINSFRFRPLSGYLISKSFKAELLEIQSNYGFRPLSGYLISKYNREWAIAVLYTRFRPLSGYLISK